MYVTSFCVYPYPVFYSQLIKHGYKLMSQNTTLAPYNGKLLTSNTVPETSGISGNHIKAVGMIPLKYIGHLCLLVDIVYIPPLLCLGRAQVLNWLHRLGHFELLRQPLSVHRPLCGRECQNCKSEHCKAPL